MDMYRDFFYLFHGRAELGEVPVSRVLKINRDMDIRHAETADACRLIRQSLFMAVKPEDNNVADAQCVDISQLLFRRLAGCCYPIIKPVPIVDGFRVGHKTTTRHELEEW